jgi:hypothetical protein
VWWIRVNSCPFVTDRNSRAGPPKRTSESFDRKGLRRSGTVLSPVQNDRSRSMNSGTGDAAETALRFEDDIGAQRPCSPSFEQSGCYRAHAMGTRKVLP